MFKDDAFEAGLPLVALFYYPHQNVHFTALFINILIVSKSVSEPLNKSAIQSVRYPVNQSDIQSISQ